MIETPEIVQSEALPAAVIHIVVPREQIQEVMGPGFMELLSTLTAQGQKPAGPFFSHHLRMDPTVWDFELGVQVSRPVTPTGRVRPGGLPAARVARTVYHGGYEGLGAAWREFEQWLAANGHATAPDLWERYLAGPEIGSDTSLYRTELSRPLA